MNCLILWVAWNRLFGRRGLEFGGESGNRVTHFVLIQGAQLQDSCDLSVRG